MQNSKIINITQALETEYQILTQKKEKEFPIEVFHPILQELILELQQKMNYATEYTSAAILSACSTAIGSQFKVEVKRNTWHEKCNLYVIIVGIAGSTKSHPLSFAFDPINARDKDAYKMYQFDLKEYQVNQNRSKENKEKSALSEVEREKPVYVKSVISDFTPEALAMSHSNNPKGITIVVDELKGWLNNFDRYNSGGEEQMYLSLWSGKSWLIDRKTQEPIRIDDPFVNVIGTIQPKLIQDFAKGDKSDNGFLDRMIFAWPKTEQPNLWNDQEVEEHHLNNYKALIQNLYDLNQSMIPEIHESDSQRNSVILTFEKQAKYYLFNWQNKEETKLLDRDNNYEKSIFAKIQNYAIRFCLILHLQDISCELDYSSVINVNIVKRAIQLAEYFRKISLEIRETIENPNPLIDLSVKQKNVLFALPKEFLKKEGVIIAETFGMPYATFSRFLKKEEFFEKSTYGNYKKLV